jgi:hypothetical protein
MINLKIYELVLVCIGDFNPVIIHPQWLVNKGLIQKNEGERAEVQINHLEISRFSLDWCTLEITRSKFILHTKDESFLTVAKDLAFSIFTILKETPLSSFGINHIFHYQVDKDQYLNIGRKLAPFENWESVLKEPRLMTLEMKDEGRYDEYEGLFRFRISPSDQVNGFGVNININDHFNLESDKTTGAKDFLQILPNVWDNSKARSLSKTEQLWKNLKK